MPESVKDAIHDIVVKQNSQSAETANGYVKALEENCAADWSVIEQSEKSFLVDEVGLPKGLAVQLAKKAKEKAAHRATLPYPDLPPGGYPEAGRLDDHLGQIAKVAPLREDVVKPGEPPSFEMLTTQEWMTVFRNCNVLKAMTMRELETPGKSILVPPNNAEAIRNLLQVSQGSAEYSSGLSFDWQFNKHAAKCEFGAFTKVSCPFISASVDYKRQTESQAVEMGTQMTQTMRYLLKVGTLYFRPKLNVAVDEDDIDKFRVDPDLDKSFRTLMRIDLDKAKLKDYKDELAQKYTQWGEIVASKVMIGLSLHSSKTFQCKETQHMEAAKQAIRTAMTGSYDTIVTCNSGGHHETYTCKEFASSHREERIQWESIGGVGCSDPQGLEQQRGNPKAWRCINYQEFHPIKDFLKKDIRDRMTAWEELCAEPSVPAAVPVPDILREGTYKLTTSRWPTWYLYMQKKDNANVRGWGSDPGKQGYIRLRKVPNDPDYWLLAPEEWPHWYIYMQDNKDGNVRGCDGDPGPQGYWKIEKNPFKRGTYRFVTKQWSSWYMYMQNEDGGNVRAWGSDPGEQGWWNMIKRA